MSAKAYQVNLTASQRQSLEAMSRKGKVSARTLRRARILLLADAGEKDKQIVKATGAGAATVQRTRRCFCSEGLEAALSDKPRPGAKRKLDARGEAHLTALACSEPPEGYSCWTLGLLAEKLVDDKIVDRISRQAVSEYLKKTT